MAALDTIFTSMLRGLIRPAVSFCLEHAIGMSALLDSLKTVLVQEAVRQLENRGEKQTVSRISVMTGITRREVDRILQASATPALVQPSVPMRIVSAWENTRRFCDKNGRPKQLKTEGEDSGFWKLVRTISKDVNPVAALKELQRIGVVKVHPNKQAELVRAVHLRGDDLEQSHELLVSELNALCRSIEQNIIGDQEIPNLYLRTSFDNIAVSDIATIREWLRVEGGKFHDRARKFLSKYDKDLNPRRRGEGNGQVVLTAFSVTEPDA